MEAGRKTVYSYTADIRALEEPDVYAACLRLLPAFRHEKLLKLRQPADRLRSAAAWALLLYALDRWYRERGLREDLRTPDDTARIKRPDPGFHTCFRQEDFRFPEGGKPFLDLPGAPDFNISHSGNWGMCTVSSAEVGCDTERIPEEDQLPGLLKAAARFFAAGEQEALFACTDRKRQAELFCRIWTMKESCIKCSGKGLRMPLDSFCVPVKEMPPADAAAGLRVRIPKGPYLLHEYPEKEGNCFSSCARIPADEASAFDPPGISFCPLQEVDLAGITLC